MYIESALCSAGRMLLAAGHKHNLINLNSHRIMM